MEQICGHLLRFKDSPGQSACRSSQPAGLLACHVSGPLPFLPFLSASQIAPRETLVFEGSERAESPETGTEEETPLGEDHVGAVF